MISLRCMQRMIIEKSKNANENFFLKMWFNSDEIALNENEDYCIAFEMLKKSIFQRIDSWKKSLKQRISDDWIFQKNFINVYMNFEKFLCHEFFSRISFFMNQSFLFFSLIFRLIIKFHSFEIILLHFSFSNLHFVFALNLFSVLHDVYHEFFAFYASWLYEFFLWKLDLMKTSNFSKWSICSEIATFRHNQKYIA